MTEALMLTFVFACLQYMEDVKVSVVPVTDDDDRSIHVKGLPGSQGANVSWPVPSWADHGEAGSGGTPAD